MSNVGAGKGAFSVDLSSADDFWRKLLNNEPSPATVAAQAATAPAPPRRYEDDSPVMGVPAVRPGARDRASASLIDREPTVMGRPRERVATPVPRRKPASDFYRQDTGVGLAQAIEKAQSKSAGFVFEDPRVTGQGGRALPVTRVGADPWARGEKRLWVAAGLLMGLAAMVLTMFALISFGGFHVWGGATASVLPAAPAPVKPVVVAAPEAAPPVNTTTPGWRPMVPARARSAERTTIASKKKNKHQKSGKSLHR